MFVISTAFACSGESTQSTFSSAAGSGSVGQNDSLPGPGSTWPVASSAPVAGANGDVATAGTPAPARAPSSDIELSTPSQTFRERITVSMSSPRPDAVIRYTTDGQRPDVSAKQYTGTPLELTTTTQLRARAFVMNAPVGNPKSAIYIARSFDAQSDLPILIIEGYAGGKPTDKKVYKDAALMLFELKDGSASLAALPSLSTRAGYHVRGQSSARLPQTPYRIELRNDADEDQDHALLGMPADSDWALIPPYYDRALIRNPLVYELGRAIGLHAPRVRFAEVYINYEARPLAQTDYLGVYWVTETIKNSSERLDLKQLREADKALPVISGGYIFKFDQAAAEEPKLSCTGSPPLPRSFGGMGMGMGSSGAATSGGMTPAGTCWTDLEVLDPEPLIPEQSAWLTSYIQRFHDALHTTPLGDYASYIDVASFVDYLLINELTRNVDAYVRSAYYHKDREGKLLAGPLWDYNFALGVGGQSSIDPAGGWQFRGSRNVNNWYPKLTSDPAFMARVKARWLELRAGVLADAAVDQRITDLTRPLAQAAVRDYAKWRVADILKPNAFVRGPSATTWEGQVQALRDFMHARSAWMDGQLR